MKIATAMTLKEAEIKESMLTLFAQTFITYHKGDVQGKADRPSIHIPLVFIHLRPFQYDIIRIRYGGGGVFPRIDHFADFRNSFFTK